MIIMIDELNTNTLSVQDIIDTYVDYDASDEAKEVIIYFISELTGISVDEIYRLAN